MIKIKHGDFFELYKTIKPGSVDLILTDPPYGCLTDVQQWDVELDWFAVEQIFSRLLKPNGLAIIFCDIQLLVKLYSTFSKYLVYKHYHIWQKPAGMVVNMKRPISDTEFVIIFKQQASRIKDVTFNPAAMGENGLPYYKKNNFRDIPTRKMKKPDYDLNETGFRFPKTIIKAPNKPCMPFAERNDHPTQKPLQLIKKLILGYSNREEMVFDPFAGSGTTLVGCAHTERLGIGFEINNDYYKIAEKRINQAMQQINLF